MLKKMVAILVIAIAFTIPKATAQKSRSIKGSVLSTGGQPLPFANVSWLSADQLLKTTQTDSAGNFVFAPASTGAFRLQVTLTGYKAASLIFTVDPSSGDITIAPVILATLQKMLDDVTVTSKKPLVEFKLDRTVINADAMITGVGLNALELLERSPGVIVDANGNISMAGKTGVLVLIDGKPSYLSGEQLATYLKSLPASTLERIELMINPPAKYDAAGGGGVIDIRTKKNRAKGMSGAASLSAGTSRSFRSSGSLNLNYYEGKVNMFGNVGYSGVRGHRILKLERNYYNGNQLATRYEQISHGRPFNQSTTVKLGTDYFVSRKTTLGVVFNGSFAPGSYRNPVRAFVYNRQHLLDSIITADNNSYSRFNNATVNLNMLHRIDSSGATVSADLDWVKYDGLSNQNFLNGTLYADGLPKSSEQITANLPVDIDIRTVKVDYSRPLPGKAKMELGLKASLVTAENTARYYSWVGNTPSIDDRNTNQFRYEENIDGGYANFSQEMKRFSYQLGIRAENTNIKARQFGNPVKNDSSFSQHYTNVFPTLYVSFKLDSAGSNVINATYGRRIDRPYYKDLNPFVYIVDRYTSFAGNPLLQPQFSSNYTIAYRHKSMLSTSFFYNHYRRYQTETVFEEGGIFISQPANIGKRIYQGVSANLMLQPKKWWRNNMYIEVVNMQFKGEVNATFINSNSTYFYIESSHQFTLGRAWTADLSGFYMTPRTAAQFNLDAKGQLSFGVQKRFWQNKASLRVAFSDVLLTNISGGSLTNVGRASSFYRNDMDTRMVNVGLSVNFGKTGNTPKTRNTGSSQSELNRVKN